MTIAESLLPEFDQEMSSTRKLLECVPDGIFDYKPHEKSMALGRLASHVAEIPGYLTATITRPKLEIPAGYKAFNVASKQELLAAFDKNAAEARAAIEGATDEHLAEPWSLVFGGHTAFTMPRAAVVRNMGMNHLIHHRAQLGVYLRLNDVAIPGMYGPSADQKTAAAQA
ncbi:MAG TPA: DinB family protein [Bryobacteraceae bacterium]|jgi:uncharacterized damage-inducible protein DinB|nr:DinB family protein [Bryobacteraceae bacterium]